MPTPAYLLATSRLIPPFGDPPGASLVLDRPLCEWQDEVLRDRGFEPIRIAAASEVARFPCLLLDDDLFLSRQYLAEFVRLAGARSVRGGMRDSIYLRTSSALQGLEPVRDGEVEGMTYRLWRLQAAADLAGRADLPAVLVDPRERVNDVPVPHGFRNKSGEPQKTAGTTRRAMHVRHWMHILRCNLDALAGALIESWEEHKLRTLFRIAVMLLTLPFTRRRLSRVGRGCRIHPTAVVEASRLGDRCQIGPYAVIQGAWLGDDVVVNAHAQVAFSILGQGSWVTRGAFTFCSLLYPESFSGQPILQVCILGRRATCASIAGLVDMGFGRNIQVMFDGQLQDSGTNFLGSCVGHGATLGTAIWVEAGREIPNGYFILGQEGHWLKKVTPGLPPGEPLVIRDFALQLARAPRSPDPGATK